MSARLACVRPAASVRSEPGSNSQVEMRFRHLLDVEPSHICLNLSPSHLTVLCSSHRSNKSRKTVKLTPGSSGSPYQADMQTVKRRCAQTAHISLLIITVSKSERTKQTEARSFLAFPEPPCLQKFSPLSRPPPVRSAVQRTVRFGEAVFRAGLRNPQEEKTPVVTFSSLFRNYPQYLGVGANFTPKHPRLAQEFFPAQTRDRGEIRPQACALAQVGQVSTPEAPPGSRHRPVVRAS